MSDNPLIAGLPASTRFTCPAAVTRYTLAKVSDQNTLAVVGTGDDETVVAGVFLGDRVAGDQAGIGFCGSRGAIIPMLWDGTSAPSAGSRVTRSTTTAGRVKAAASGGIGTLITAPGAVADAIVLVIFDGTGAATAGTSALTLPVTFSDGASTIGTVSEPSANVLRIQANAVGQPIELCGGEQSGVGQETVGGVRLRPGTSTDWLECVLDDAGFPIWRLNSIPGTQLVMGSTLAIGAGSNVVIPFFADVQHMGWTNRFWRMVHAWLYTTKVGPEITAAATIAPTRGIHPLAGTTPITTITPPSEFDGGTIVFLPSEAAVFNTGGNISNAFTATAGVPVHATWSGTLWWLK